MKKIADPILVAGVIIASVVTAVGNRSRPAEMPVQASEQDSDRFAELQMLARVVQAEAGNQDYNGKRLVVDVIYNRMMSDDFPDTLEGVIYQPGQFAVMWDGAYDRAIPTAEDMQAVVDEIDEELDYEVLYFSAGSYNPCCVPMYQHGDHYFGR